MAINPWQETGIGIFDPVQAELELSATVDEQVNHIPAQVGPETAADEGAPLPESLLHIVRSTMAEGGNAYGDSNEVYAEAGWFFAPKGWFRFMDYQKQYADDTGCVHDMLYAPVGDETDVQARVEMMELIESGFEWDEGLKELEAPTASLQITEDKLFDHEAAEFARREAEKPTPAPKPRPRIIIPHYDLDDGLSLPIYASQPVVKPTDIRVPGPVIVPAETTEAQEQPMETPEIGDDQLTSLQYIYSKLVPKGVQAMAFVKGEVTKEVMLELCNKYAMPKINEAMKKRKKGLPNDLAGHIATAIIKKRKASNEQTK